MEQHLLPERCPNCINLLPKGSKFCPHCGQKVFGRHDQSIWHLILESVGDFFHFDSKFPGTIRSLLFRPGFLTSEFLAGRRVRYFEPFKLFLFISFLYFLISGITGQKDPQSDGIKVVDRKSGKVIRIDSDTAYNRGHISLNLTDELDSLLILPDDTMRYMISQEGLNSFVETRAKQSPWIAKFLAKGVFKDRLTGTGTIYHNFQKTIPKLIFILIPIFALLLKLLYIRKKVPYYNHAIFSLHFLSFYFLMMIVSSLAGFISSWSAAVAWLLCILYLYLALLNVYKEKKRTALLKFIIFLAGSGIIAIFFFIMAALISFTII